MRINWKVGFRQKKLNVNEFLYKRSIFSDIFKKNGNVADAAVAVIFCEGVAMPYSTGLGGGFVMTIYTKAKTKIETMIARERAPLLAHENMYENGESSSVGKTDTK